MGATRNAGKRRLSKRQRAIYRRRRIVVGVVLLVALALVSFCVYSLGRGAAAAFDATWGGVSRVALERGEVTTPHKSSGVKDCSAKDTRLLLTAKTATVPVGGSLEFVATIEHEGTDSCLVDASDSGRVLTIRSGGDVVWRSDACPAEARQLLMAKGDKDIQSMTWGANRTSDQCVENQDDLPKVDRGTYTAELSLKNAPKVTSEKVTVEVQ
ncbi:hypothetical protein GFD21_08725 [Bifidobacterium sp. SMA15]|uniref:Peptide ABC transporter permease n=2 Tax=Bifidobacterium platyrrhinorum TaxID=2661628 RepID=A0A6L9STK7_9BIFI|nr:hypothetical protein [Bifidobacterium platyrrhinorum]NEG55834.1 hypothetical protein [Bifidobacterium platyrrhinorum]